MVLCAAPDCRRDEPPRQAASGLRLCLPCRHRIGRDAWRAARLHSAIGQTMASPQRQQQLVTTRGNSGINLADEAVEARTAIWVTLTWVCVFTASQRGITPPQDSVISMALYVARHAEWLAGTPRAGAVAKELRDAATDLRSCRLAWPSRSASLYVGTCPVPLHDGGVCGARLRQHPDEPLLRCPRCGTEDTIEQWSRWLVGTGDGIVDAGAAATQLSMKWWRPVDASLIRQWAHRGKLTAVRIGNGAARDSKGRVCYRLADVLACAEALWGPPPSDNRSAYRAGA